MYRMPMIAMRIDENNGGEIMKILVLANSFGEDSTKYLYDMAKFGGEEHKIVNLYIGGCCLERHYRNVMEDLKEYDYQLNGRFYGRKVSFKEVLLEDQWDIVTLQQCSGYSGLIDSYEPYFKTLVTTIGAHAPYAKILIHQTWAYEKDSDHGHFEFYDHDQSKMYLQLKSCYEAMSQEYGLEIISFGDLIQALRALPIFDYDSTGFSLCRDGFHMHFFYGRYALSALWYHLVLKGNLKDNAYIPQQVEGMVIEMDKIEAIKSIVLKF